MVPWRNGRGRKRSFDWCQEWWKHEGYTPILADSGHTPFNRAASRNLGVHESKADIIVVCDADSHPEWDALQQAILIATTSDTLVYPFDNYVKIHVDTQELVGTYGQTPGGCWVCKRSLWWDLGGQDERFNFGWAPEDNAFRAVANTLAKVKYIPGKLTTYTQHDIRPKGYDTRGYQRWIMYRTFIGKPEQMRELIRGNHAYEGPGGTSYLRDRY